MKRMPQRRIIVTVLNRGQIEASHLPTVASALSTFPGIAVVPSGAPGQLTSVFTRGTESNHTLLTIDGRRQVRSCGTF